MLRHCTGVPPKTKDRDHFRSLARTLFLHYIVVWGCAAIISAMDRGCIGRLAKQVGGACSRQGKLWRLSVLDYTKVPVWYNDRQMDCT